MFFLSHERINNLIIRLKIIHYYKFIDFLLVQYLFILSLYFFYCCESFIFMIYILLNLLKL